MPRSRAAAVSSSITRSPLSESSAPVGSSANSTRGSVTSARATATRWPSPPETVAGALLGDAVDLERAQQLVRPAPPPARGAPSSRSGSATFSRQDSSGTSWPNWKTNPNSDRRSALRSASDSADSSRPS